MVYLRFIFLSMPSRPVLIFWYGVFCGCPPVCLSERWRGGKLVMEKETLEKFR